MLCVATCDPQSYLAVFLLLLVADLNTASPSTGFDAHSMSNSESAVAIISKVQQQPIHVHDSAEKGSLIIALVNSRIPPRHAWKTACLE